MRLRIDLAYNGSGFNGWAAQQSSRTVQGVLEHALATVLRRPIRVICAGRTDAGVHARGQVVHAEVDQDALLAATGRSPYPPPQSLARRLNGVLPDDVHVARVTEAPTGFDARFSALWRRYSYRLADDPMTVDPLTREHVVPWPQALDVVAMNDASRALVGQHDFAAFCKKREGATTIRTLLELCAERDPRGVIVATVRADAFCHHMVRCLMGCLVRVGEGRFAPDWPKHVLAAGIRDPRVVVMPPHGLVLEEVCYPPDDRLAERAHEAKAVRTSRG